MPLPSLHSAVGRLGHNRTSREPVDSRPIIIA
nr:MAG TPA: hypothetical protein [Caudoviricetes sp.]